MTQNNNNNYSAFDPIIIYYAWRTTQHPQFGAYEVSIARYMAEFHARIYRDENYDRRVPLLRKALEQGVYVMVMVTFLSHEMGRVHISSKRKEMVTAMLYGQDLELQDVYRDISFIVGTEPAQTKREMHELRQVVVQIVTIILSLLKPVDVKAEVITRVFATVTRPPPSSSSSL